MNAKMISIVMFLAGSAFIAPANAENCRAIGCVGRIGYVYLPASQQNPKGALDFMVNGTKVVLPYKYHVFTEGGIPPVNATVSLAQPHTPLFSQSDIGQNVGAFGESRPKINPATSQYELGEEQIPDDSGNLMDGGTKLKVLGYRLWASQKGLDGQLLFALVRVEAEP
jgi:hypothetical protein